MTKMISRDKKGRFCSPKSNELKSMSLISNTKIEDVSAQTIINLMNTFYKTNANLVQNIIRINKDIPTRKCNTNMKVQEPSFIFTVVWEQA